MVVHFCGYKASVSTWLVAKKTTKKKKKEEKNSVPLYTDLGTDLSALAVGYIAPGFPQNE